MRDRQHAKADDAHEPQHIEHGNRPRVQRVPERIGQTEHEQDRDHGVQHRRAGQVIERRLVTLPVEHGERLLEIADDRLHRAKLLDLTHDADVLDAAGEHLPVLHGVDAQRHNADQRCAGHQRHAFDIVAQAGAIDNQDAHEPEDQERSHHKRHDAKSSVGVHAEGQRDAGQRPVATPARA